MPDRPGRAVRILRLVDGVGQAGAGQHESQAGRDISGGRQRRTLRLIAFTAEEIGNLRSRARAALTIISGGTPAIFAEYSGVYFFTVSITASKPVVCCAMNSRSIQPRAC